MTSPDALDGRSRPGGLAALGVLEVVRPLDRAGRRSGFDFGVKANFDLAGRVTTAGSAARADLAIAASDAYAVAALRRAGGSPSLVTTMDELAYGFTGRNHHHGDLASPHDSRLLSGGSSSGSAAVVAAGLVPVALGSDTNGSVRVPAAVCGVWGMRPSMDPRLVAGLVPLAPTLDVPGVLAADAASMIAASTSLAPWWHVQVERPAAPRVALVADLVAGAWSDGAATAVAETLAAAWSCPLDTIELGWLASARDAARTITAAEAAAAHGSLLDPPHNAGLGPLVRERLEAGARLDLDEVDGAYRVRSELRADLERTFAGADLLVMATLGVDPPTLDADEVCVGAQMVPVNAAMGLHTSPFSLLGAPGLAVPVPMGTDRPHASVQLVARPGQDALLHRAATSLETSGTAAARVR